MGFNRDREELFADNNESIYKRAFALHYGLDGQPINSYNMQINISVFQNDQRVFVKMNVTRLRDIVKSYYMTKNIPLPSSYPIDIRLNESNPIYVNSSGMIVPRSYKPRLWLKSKMYGWEQNH